MTKKHIVYEGDKDKPSIYLLHGLGNDCRGNYYFAKYFNKKGYTVHKYTANGHFQVNHKLYLWNETIKEYVKRFDKDNTKEIIVIGISFGGSISIKLCKHSKVKKVFSIAGLHDDSGFKYPTLIQTMISDDIEYTKKVQKHIKPALAMSFKLTPNQSKKLYLIHSEQDYVVPFEHFVKNKKKFNIPKNRTLVYPQIGHAMLLRRKEIREWIYNRIVKV